MLLITNGFWGPEMNWIDGSDETRGELGELTRQCVLQTFYSRSFYLAFPDRQTREQ